MLTNRIIGAFQLRKSVYAEVEKDGSFTTITALALGLLGLVAPALGGGRS